MGGGELRELTKTPSDYKTEETQSFERKPTGGIQEIAGKSFTVNHIEKFANKDKTKTFCVVETDEVFHHIEYKDENDTKVRGDVSRFFASPVEIKRFFTRADVMKDVNELGEKIKCNGIEVVPFTSEEIAKTPDLKGKTHYVFIGKQETIA